LVLSPEKKDKESRRRRELIVKTLEDLKVKLLNPAYGRPPVKKTFPPQLFPQMFFKEDVELLKKADWVIADLTDPDFKTGTLIAEAFNQQKIVLGLFWEKLDSFRGIKSDLFYTDCFNKDNVHSVLRHFLRFLKRQRQKRGKLIVIEGTDGSGKATQSKLLIGYLKSKNYLVKHIDFPRYKSSFHGKMVGRYLKGDFGGLSKVDPHYASLFYALDRAAAKPEIEDWLSAGCIVIANRYATSSMAFQTARVKPEKREEFLNWLTELEYKINKLPKEDLVIFLHLPALIGRKLVLKKTENREHLRGKKYELYEANMKLMKEAEKMYLYLAKKFPHWVKIKCVDKNQKILPIEKIHQKIISTLRKRHFLPVNISQ